MATEHEIDRMVVRLVGNQEDYQKMLKDVEKQTEESAKFAEKQGGLIARAFNNAFKAAQGGMSTFGSAFQNFGDTLKGPQEQQKATMGKAAMDFSDYGKSIKDLVRETEKAAKEAEELKKRIVGNTEAFKDLKKVVKLTEEETQV